MPTIEELLESIRETAQWLIEVGYEPDKHNQFLIHDKLFSINADLSEMFEGVMNELADEAERGYDVSLIKQRKRNG